MDKIYFFTQDQGNLLIRLLLAHILADFVFQSRKMVEEKTWFSSSMLFHILIVFGITILLSASFKMAFIIALSHWLIDSVKATIQQKTKHKEHTLFVIDQVLHLLVIVALWTYKFELFQSCYQAILLPFSDYKLSLYLISYAIVIWPLGYLIKFALDKMELLGEAAPAVANTSDVSDKNQNIKNAGKLIGQFERIIILTFVLLGQYEAIGFLITGKSIIRFAQKEENLKSEYVLVGTMMSYALSILIGLMVNWLINI